MNFKTVFMAVLMIVSFLNSAELQNLDSPEKPPVESIQTEVRSYYQLNKWFLEQEKEIGIKYSIITGDESKAMRLVHVSSISATGNLLGDRYIRVGIEYDWPLNTTSFVFGTSLYRNAKWDFSALGYIGGGSTKAHNISYAVSPGVEAKDRVDALVGIAGEASYGFSKSFSAFFGINHFFVFTENSGDGRNLNFYGGLRAFLASFHRYRLAWDIKGGWAYYGAFPQNPSGGSFFGTGICLISDSPFIWAGPPRLAPLETSLLFSPGLRVLSTKLTVPFRIFEQMSVGLNGFLGTDTRTLKVAASPSEIGTFLGYGMELRLYGDQLEPVLNPYVGFLWGRYEYENSENPGKGTVVQIGNRLPLNKNICLDVFTGPAFWKTPWATALGGPLDAPSAWNFGIGFTWRTGIGKQEMAKNFKGTIKVYKKDVPEEYKSGTIEPIDPEKASPNSEEIRVFVYDSTKCPDNTRALGDVTDIKFSKVEVQELSELLNLGTTPLRDFKSQAKTSVLILALFDKNRVRTEFINVEKDQPNIYLHFLDVSTGKVFGYYWDSTRVAQPEWRNDLEFNPRDNTKKIFFGNYEEYVRPLKWLDQLSEDDLEGMGISYPGGGSKLAKGLLEKMNKAGTKTNYLFDPTYKSHYPIDVENYRLAFAVYPEALINSVIARCGGRGYGMNIMFRFDHNRNGDGEWPMFGHFIKAKDEKDNDYHYSEGITDDAFFSNMIIGSELFGLKVVIDGFALCRGGDSGDKLPFDTESENEKAKSKLKEILELIEFTPNATKLILSGKTDATEPNPKDGPCAHVALAERRAISVEEWLKKLQAEEKISKLKIEFSKDQGLYTPDPQKFQPKQRAVVITAE